MAFVELGLRCGACDAACAAGWSCQDGGCSDLRVWSDARRIDQRGQGDGSEDNTWASRYDAKLHAWGEPELLEAAIGGAFLPNLAAAADGSVIAVWSQYNGQHHDILANRYDPEARSWGSARLMENNDDEGAGNPDVVLDDQGNAIVVWTHGNAVWENRYDAGKASWRGAETIPGYDATQPARFPDLSLSANGEAVVAWQWGENDQRSIIVNHLRLLED